MVPGIHKITCVVNDIARENSGLLSEHGQSFWIETEAGKVLFDTGQTGQVLTHNLKVLGLELGEINALVLSHAHNDHTGGLEPVLSANPNLAIYAHPDIFRARYSRKGDQVQSIGISQTRDSIANQAKLILNDTPTQIIRGLWTTGEITARSEPEGRSNKHFLLTEAGWQPDTYRDDISLVMEMDGGVAVICGCCHAGLLNTLKQVKMTFHKTIRVVVGGTHLITADGPALRYLIDVLHRDFPDLAFFLNHCTGEEAFQKLAQAFGSRVVACPAGTMIDLDELFR